MRSRVRLSKPGRPGHMNGLAGRGGVVTAVHPAQVFVAERLDSEAEAIDALGPQGRQVGLREVVRIGLQGHLFHLGGVPQRGGSTDQSPDLFRRTERRRFRLRNRAYVGVVHRKKSRLRIISCFQGLEQHRFPGQGGAGVEVAVVAATQTERNMKNKDLPWQ